MKGSGSVCRDLSEVTDYLSHSPGEDRETLAIARLRARTVLSRTRSVPTHSVSTREVYAANALLCTSNFSEGFILLTSHPLPGSSCFLFCTVQLHLARPLQLKSKILPKAQGGGRRQQLNQADLEFAWEAISYPRTSVLASSGLPR